MHCAADVILTIESFISHKQTQQNTIIVQRPAEKNTQRTHTQILLVITNYNANYRSIFGVLLSAAGIIIYRHHELAAQKKLLWIVRSSSCYNDPHNLRILTSPCPVLLNFRNHTRTGDLSTHGR